MTVNDSVRHADLDRVLVQCVAGGPDLVCLGRDTRAFLTGLDDLVASKAVLIAVMLASDAFRYGRPPVTLRLQHLAAGTGLRVEVEDHGSARLDPRPHGYRANLLDQIASRHGLVQSGGGTTAVWVEIRTAPPLRHRNGAVRPPGPNRANLRT